MSPNVKELHELLVFLFTAQDAIKNVLEDKKVNVLDAFKFVPVLPTIKPAFDNLQNPVQRLRELIPEEREDLHNELVEGFDIPNDRVEELVERTIAIAADIIQLVKDWKAVGK